MGGEEDNMSQIEQLQPITQPSELTKAIGGLDPQAPKPLVTQLGRGVLGFREATFPDIDYDRVYAQKFKREPNGRGPHFDVYNTLIDEDHPVIGVYNLTGDAVLRAVALSQKLQEYYDAMYPEPTDEAFEQRRGLSSLALGESGITVMEGKIKPAMGMIFPQFAQGRHLVHDVVPAKSEGKMLPLGVDANHVGSFVKFAVPKDKLTAKEDFESRGYVPFSQFVEEQLAGVSYEERNGHTPAPEERVPFPTSSILLSRRPAPMPRRSCNLD